MSTSDPLPIDPQQLRVLLADTLTDGTGPAVVWVDGDGSELLVALSDVQVAVLDGVVAVGLLVRCDQVGATDLTAVVMVGTQAGRSVPLLVAEQLGAGPEGGSQPQVIAVMRQRLAAGEQVARMYQAPGLAGMPGRGGRAAAR